MAFYPKWLKSILAFTEVLPSLRIIVLNHPGNRTELKCKSQLTEDRATQRCDPSIIWVSQRGGTKHFALFLCVRARKIMVVRP